MVGGGRHPRGSTRRCSFAGSLLCAVLAMLSAQGAARRSSLIDLISLRQPSFAQGIYGATAYRIAVSVLPFLLPLMFQLGFGLSAFRSGLYLLALFAGDLSMKVHRRADSTALGLQAHHLLERLHRHAGLHAAVRDAQPRRPPCWLLLAILFFHGAVRSLEFTAIGTLAYAEIPPAAHVARQRLLFHGSAAWAWVSASR